MFHKVVKRIMRIFLVSTNGLFMNSAFEGGGQRHWITIEGNKIGHLFICLLNEIM